MQIYWRALSAVYPWINKSYDCVRYFSDFFDICVYGIVPRRSSPPALMSCPTNQVDPINELSHLGTNEAKAYSSC